MQRTEAGFWVFIFGLFCAVAVTLAGLARPVQAARPTTESSMNSIEGQVTCATTVTRIPCKTSGVRAIHVKVDAAATANVAFGGSAVTYANSPIVRAASGEYSANRGAMWCIATGSSQTVEYSCLE